MTQKIFNIAFLLALLCPLLCGDMIYLDTPQVNLGEEPWNIREPMHIPDEPTCLTIKPPSKDIVRRFYAILPYFNKEHANSVFLHKYRGTVYALSDSNDILDREAGYYASVLTPLVFLQQPLDTWCLLERFHRALRLYQMAHPADKRSALKLLQNLRSVNQKVRRFIIDVMPTHEAPTSDSLSFNDNEHSRYLSDLVKNIN